MNTKEEELVLKRGKRYLVKEHANDRFPLSCKWYGYRQKDPSQGIERSGHLFLFAGSSDSGYILTESEVQKLVVEWMPERGAEVEAEAERWFKSEGID